MAKPLSPQMRRIQAQLLKQRQATKAAEAKLAKARANASASKRQSNAQLAKTVAERSAARRATTAANKNTQAEKAGRSNDRFVASAIGGTAAGLASVGAAAGYEQYNKVKKSNASLQAEVDKQHMSAYTSNPSSSSSPSSPSSWWADRKKQGRGY